MNQRAEPVLTPPLLPAVKPDPPESVRLRAAGQQLQVLWHPPASWPFPDIFSLKYRVRYRRHGASHFRQVRGGWERLRRDPQSPPPASVGALRSHSAAGLPACKRLTQQAGSYPPPSLFPQVGPIEATTFTLRTTKPHAKYCIQVSAQDLTDYGKPSDWSLPGQAERTPQKP
ncbi:Epstein-Barr virus induced gene 3 [Cricetulus griseus]